MRISSPDRVYFSARGETKLDLARYYMSVGDGIVRALRERPCMLHRFPGGVDGQEGPPEAGAPGRARLAARRSGSTSRVRPHRRRAVRDRAGQRDLGGADVHGRVSSLELAAAPTSSTPTSGGSTSTRCPSARLPRVRRVADVAHEVLDELGDHRLAEDLGRVGASTSTCASSRAGASATCAARRWRSRARWSAARPADATTTWWRKDREPDKAFVDYNQNARDHTIACAYSVRGVRDGDGLDPDRLGRDR